MCVCVIVAFILNVHVFRRSARFSRLCQVYSFNIDFPGLDGDDFEDDSIDQTGEFEDESIDQTGDFEESSVDHTGEFEDESIDQTAEFENEVRRSVAHASHSICDVFNYRAPSGLQDCKNRTCSVSWLEVVRGVPNKSGVCFLSQGSYVTTYA